MSLIKSFGYHRGLYWRHMITSCDPLTQQMKTCSQCAELLPFSDFGKDACASDGLRSECKTCLRKSRRTWASLDSPELKIKHKNRERNRKRQYRESIHSNIGRLLLYYIVNPSDPSIVKIGHSASIGKRFETFLTVIPKIYLLALVEIDDPRKERDLHWQFEEFCHEGEWFLVKSPLLQHLDSLDQSLAHQCIPLLIPSQQKRVIVPDKQHFIDSVPFLGK